MINFRLYEEYKISLIDKIKTFLGKRDNVSRGFNRGVLYQEVFCRRGILSGGFSVVYVQKN